MSIAELLFLLLSKKKSLVKFVLGSSIAYGAYAGAIRPSISSSVTEVDGANSLQGKQKDSINLAKSRITNVDNVLELTSLKNLEQNQHKFHSSLSKYLVKKNLWEKQEFNWWKANVGKIKEANDSESYCKSCSTLSDRDIIYGDTYFLERVSQLQDPELVQDILWSLWEESKYSGTLIHAETIKVNLQVDRSNKVPEVKQFSLSFKVSNLSGRKAKVFRTIEIEPDSQTEINILLSNGELRPTPIAGGKQAFKYTAWNLFPKNAQWKVVKNIQQPRKQTISEVHESLQIIYGSSRFISESISRSDDRKVAVNTIDYSYIKDKLTPYLNEITEEQVEKDIESWYGGYTSYLLRTRIEDIKEIINLMQKKTIENDRGIKESVFERTLNSFQFRNNLYHHFKFNETFKNVFDKLLTNNKGSDNEKVRIKIEEIIGLLKSWVWQLEQIQDSIRVDIEWAQKPKKVYSEAGRNGQFPHFSFNFKQKITWVKEMKIPLKGTWNVDKYEEEAEGKSENGKYVFNITDKLVNLKDILAPLTSTIAELTPGGQLGGIDIMNTLIPEAGKFIGLDSIKINQGESISYTYQTTSTPLTLALDETSDLQDKYFPGMNIGWKALDVSASLDLSNFSQLFYSIYEKLDVGEKNKAVLSYGDFTRITEELKKTPITFIAHAINSVFDETYNQRVPRNNNDKKPWPVFFNSLFSSGITFQNSQMMTGYSQLFFQYPKWWGKDNKNKTNCKLSQTEQTQEKEHWCTKFSFKDRGKIVTPKNDEIRNISQSLMFNQSMYLPDAPIVLSNSLSGGQYDLLLKDEKRGKSSEGLLRGAKEILQSVKQEYDAHYSYLEGRKVIDWEKAKVSFAQLNLKKAINSVLALKSPWGQGLTGSVLGLAGFYFHQILGEALVRDGFWINVNLMHEYGMFTKRDLHVTRRMDYFSNSELWLKATPILDHTKLNFGSTLNGLLLGKK